MATFDAVRNRQRGEEAKQRVLSRTYAPKEEQQESAFSAVRNRSIVDPPVPEDTRARDLLKSTLESVGVGSPAPFPKAEPIDFMADQAKKKKIEAFQGKLPAPSALNIPVTALQTQLQGRLPVASALNQTGGGPADASHNQLRTEYDIRDKAIDETNIPEALKYPSRALNTLAFGNPVGRFISNSLSGNSGVTQRDSTGSAAADKVSDVINQLVTPFITPSGAPVGSGFNAAPYEAAGKLLNTGKGMKVTNALSKLIPKASPGTANNIARVGLTEGLAGTAQNVAAGLMNQQDSNKDIATNALIGGVAGLGLGLAGGAVRPALDRFAAVRAARKVTPAETPAAATVEPVAPMDTTPVNNPINDAEMPLNREQIISRKYMNDEKLTPEEIDFMVSDEWNPENLNSKNNTIAQLAEPNPATPDTVPELVPAVKTEIQEVDEAIQAANQPNIRDKVYSYLDEAEKAARERISKRKGNLNSSPLPEWGDYAIIMASKLGKKTIKAVNFADELVKEFGEDMRPHAEKSCE